MIALLIFVTGCAGPASDIGTVDLTQLQSSWPKFINYQNQLASDERAIEISNVPESQKASERDELRKRYDAMQSEVENDVVVAAAKVAQARHMKLVVTRAYVGYGGVDVTSDVERALGITPASPAKS